MLQKKQFFINLKYFLNLVIISDYPFEKIKFYQQIFNDGCANKVDIYPHHFYCFVSVHVYRNENSSDWVFPGLTTEIQPEIFVSLLIKISIRNVSLLELSWSNLISTWYYFTNLNLLVLFFTEQQRTLQ